MIDGEKVMSWLEGLTEPDWRECYSDSEVQETAKQALELLKAQRETIDELISADKALELLKEQEAAEGRRIVREYCAKNTKDVADEVIGKLCRPSDEEPDVCNCAMKCPEHTNKHESTTFKPHYINEYGKHFICGVECCSCHEKISRTYHYCPYCGKAVKWE